MRELAERMGCAAYLIDSAADIQQQWLAGIEVIGVTAGASAPEILVREVIEQLKLFGGSCEEELVGVEEKIVFALPRALRA